MKSFIEQLWGTGRLRVEAGAFRSEEAAPALARVETRLRLQLPGDPPAFDLLAGLWAVSRLYELCQAAAFPEFVLDLASWNEGPDGEDPAAAYSADVGLRALPALLGGLLARAPEPARAAAEELAQRFPLSSLGWSGLNLDRPWRMLAHPSLRMLAADRIIAAGELRAAGVPALRAVLGEALGGFPELAPRFAEALETGADNDG